MGVFGGGTTFLSSLILKSGSAGFLMKLLAVLNLTSELVKLVFFSFNSLNLFKALPVGHSIEFLSPNCFLSEAFVLSFRGDVSNLTPEASLNGESDSD